MSTDRTTRPRSAALRSATAATRRRHGLLTILGAAIAIIAVVAGVAFLVQRGPAESGAVTESGAATAVHGSEKYPYAIGEPGPGEQAPGFALPSSTGGDISLSDYRGQSVLLYFQEGVMCQACYDQITDLEKRAADIEAAGVDQILSITTDPVDVSVQKMRDMGLSTPVLADTDLTVSEKYDTNSYGMMGDTRNGHTFMLISPEGEIRWRADYGGEPNYIMYLPVDQLLADMEAGPDQGGA
ncbi:peroxiredoxin Q/BCP [Spinactinospora alkalitolerans]|uniref:Peroxiredoxin Q/BCP n=1 Tax=Spinactinospora alkalitolerans TaxID=687207 RepID=A0A852TY89_9ACTN|nr:peroxiredoxin family protein [Spinactinospora alkalitolerans]NYE49506.1 peroxiredoxin Q/BCP [Spinactinospora alkalitolerans]